MEEDRALTNLGPEIDVAEELQQEAEQSSIAEESAAGRQPRKRFVGSRAATQRATTNLSKDGTSSEVNLNIQSQRPPRISRTLNQIPPEILHDSSINEAIALLPNNYNFEIHKTIHRIRTSSARNVALQFPEGLLLFAPTISDILTQFCPGTDTLIMGDVTYGACCVDDYTAKALGCDLLVHYGHSCLIPVDTTKGIKTLYVFVTIGIDTEHLIATIERNFQQGQKIALVGTVQFNAALHSIVPRLNNLGFQVILPRAAPLSAGEILGCTAPTLTASSQKLPPSSTAQHENSAKSSVRSSTAAAVLDADMILYVGDGRFHLESILIASPTLKTHTYRYDPYTRRVTHETYEHAEMHSLRRGAINTARKTLETTRSNSGPTPGLHRDSQPRTWGIILGTLGRQGNPHTLSLITAHLKRLRMPYITLLLSEITPQKLALMSTNVAVWVQIACPRLSIDWGYAFPRPLLSPYEACIALNIKDGDSWLAEDNGVEGEEEPHAEEESRPWTLQAPLLKRPMESPRPDPPIYPMDFYGKEGLGRTKAEDVPDFSALEIEVT